MLYVSAKNKAECVIYGRCAIKTEDRMGIERMWIEYKNK